MATVDDDQPERLHDPDHPEGVDRARRPSPTSTPQFTNMQKRTVMIVEPTVDRLGAYVE